MNKPLQPDPEDSQLFRQQVGPVKRLRHDRAEPFRAKPAPVPLSTQADERQVLIDMVSNYFEPADLDTGDELYFSRAGLQHGVLRKLRRGQFRVSATLDLHGMTVAVARQAFLAFLHDCRRNSMTCVRIIHGKGKGSHHKGPVLKSKVNHWLRQREEVLAFCSARPVDGGTGAVYVLLKRRV
ncbi:MAG: Smr/MutS family protein [Gammaproteobacteria bacterium]|nr:Smr/MutS family protein [Gammaproteobacteria bacterium]MCP5423484.1 Smr/MutS family protein [Gammaproteobacteria bacterium]